jgi:hypothetical protein
MYQQTHISAAAEAAAKPAVKTEVLVRLTAVPADAKYKVLKVCQA